jgi:hypothetical protein
VVALLGADDLQRGAETLRKVTPVRADTEEQREAGIATRKKKIPFISLFISSLAAALLRS